MLEYEIELSPATKEELDNNLFSFMANEGEDWKAVRINGELSGFLFADFMNEAELKIYVIEIIHEGRGDSIKLLKWLFETYDLTAIYGYSIRSATSYWKHIGAVQPDGYEIPHYEDEFNDGYIDWEGNFVLTRYAFEQYYMLQDE